MITPNNDVAVVNEGSKPCACQHVNEFGECIHRWRRFAQMFFPICAHLRHLRMILVARIGDSLRLGPKTTISERS